MNEKILKERLKTIFDKSTCTQLQHAEIIGISLQTYRRFRGLNKYDKSFSPLVLKKIMAYVKRQENLDEYDY